MFIMCEQSLQSLVERKKIYSSTLEWMNYLSTKMAIIRKSQSADSAAVASVICRSITELCVADHRNQLDILEPWLANKTKASAEQWITSTDSLCLTALADAQEIVGFGMLSGEGELLLLYVSPDQIGAGVGRDLLSEIERHAIATGLQKIFLDSTDSAMNFYQHHGYTRKGVCNPRADGLRCNSMAKVLAK